MNMNGGKWIVRLKKGLASRYWESLVSFLLMTQKLVGVGIPPLIIFFFNFWTYIDNGYHW
jgi:hypothetical protein